MECIENILKVYYFIHHMKNISMKIDIIAKHHCMRSPNYKIPVAGINLVVDMYFP